MATVAEIRETLTETMRTQPELSVMDTRIAVFSLLEIIATLQVEIDELQAEVHKLKLCA